ncbi:hypothetical protein DSO57_1019603 [Entomophthora muscae]|uniref:Uncharacterized protein n=1 Tax=Entomophthora muscae TaxID=34485 RepID=A0ACC2T3U7_9FUNG|nr:hypothetical protein DSO57_1019603 [Entomophthora muscae]
MDHEKIVSEHTKPSRYSKDIQDQIASCRTKLPNPNTRAQQNIREREMRSPQTTYSSIQRDFRARRTYSKRGSTERRCSTYRIHF